MYSYISKAYKKKWGKAYVVLEQNTVGIVTIRTIMQSLKGMWCYIKILFLCDLSEWCE